MNISQIINGKYVEGFYIYARQLDTNGNESTYKMLTVLNGGGASTCTVVGLLKYSLYEFFIVPFYKSVEGKPSNSRSARTMEDGKRWCMNMHFLFPILYIIYTFTYIHSNTFLEYFYYHGFDNLLHKPLNS